MSPSGRGSRQLVSALRGNKGYACTCRRARVHTHILLACEDVKRDRMRGDRTVSAVRPSKDVDLDCMRAGRDPHHFEVYREPVPPLCRDSSATQVMMGWARGIGHCALCGEYGFETLWKRREMRCAYASTRVDRPAMSYLREARLHKARAEPRERVVKGVRVIGDHETVQKNCVARKSSHELHRHEHTHKHAHVVGA